MSDAERAVAAVETLAAAIAVLGLWLLIAPFALPGAEFALTHAVVGGAVAAIAGGYVARLRRNPGVELASIWFVLVLGLLLLAGALLAQTPGTVFFWSTVVSSSLVVLLTVVAVLWGSGLAADERLKAAIFGER